MNDVSLRVTFPVIDAIPVPTFTGSYPRFLCRVHRVNLSIEVTVTGPVSIHFPIPVFWLDQRRCQRNFHSPTNLLFIIVHQCFGKTGRSTDCSFTCQVVFQLVIIRNIKAQTVVPYIESSTDFVRTRSSRFKGWTANHFRIYGSIHSVPYVGAYTVSLIRIINTQVALRYSPGTSQFPEVQPFGHLQ